MPTDTPPPKLTQQLQVAQIAQPDSRVGFLFGRGRFASHFVRYNDDDLVGRQGLRIYDEMRRDEQVKAALNLKKAAIIGPGWKLDAASEEDRDIRLRDQLIEDLDALPGPMEDVLGALLTALDYGFALAELVFALDGGRLRLVKVQPVAPHGITFDQEATGMVRAILQDGTKDPMPPGKFLHYVHAPEFANPYGTSDLRAAHRSWWHKINWVQWLAVWGEKLADAPVIINFAKQASDTEVANSRNVAEHLQARTVMTVPEGWEVKLLEQGRDVRSVFLEAIDHHDRQIGKALLVPDKLGLVGGEVQGGSFSLSKTQLGAFLFHIDLEQRALEACIQEQLIGQLAALIDPAAAAPIFTLLPAGDEDKVAIANAWTAIVKGGVPETPRDWNHTRNLLGYPEMSPEEVAAAQAEKEQAKADMQAMRQQAGQNQPPQDGQPPQGQQDQQPQDTQMTAATLELRIEQHGEEWWVLNQDGTKVLGKYGTKAEAVRRLRQIEGHKAHDMAAMPAGQPGAGLYDAQPFWRALRPQEARLNMTARLTDFELGANAAASILGDVADQLAQDLRGRAAKLLKAEPVSPQAVRELAPAKGIAKRGAGRLEDVLRAAFERGIQGARDDAAAAQQDARDTFVRLSADMLGELHLAEPGLIGRLARRFFQAKSFYMTGILEQDMLARVQAILFNAIKGDKPARVVLLEIDQAVADYVPVRDAAGREVNVPHRLETTARTNLAEAVNEGRFQYFTRPELQDVLRALEYSAILDDRTRATHRAWDGVRREANWWPGPPDRRPPAGFNCRCLLIPITITDQEPLTPDEALPGVPFPDPGFR